MTSAALWIRARKAIRSTITTFGPIVIFDISEALTILFGSTQGSSRALDLLGPKIQRWLDHSDDLDLLASIVADTLTSPEMFGPRPVVMTRPGLSAMDRLLIEMNTIFAQPPIPRRTWDPGFQIIDLDVKLPGAGDVKPIALPAAPEPEPEPEPEPDTIFAQPPIPRRTWMDEDHFAMYPDKDDPNMVMIQDADVDVVRVPLEKVAAYLDEIRGDELPKLRTRVSELESELRDANTRGDGFERALQLERNKLRAFELPEAYPNGTFDTVGEHRDYLANWNGQLQDKIRAKDKTIGDLRGSVHRLEDQVRVEKAEIRALRAEVEKRASEVEKRAEDERVLAARLESVEDRNRELRTKIGRVSSETKLVRDDRDQLREALDTVRDSVESMVRDGSISLETAKRIVARI